MSSLADTKQLALRGSKSKALVDVAKSKSKRRIMVVFREKF